MPPWIRLRIRKIGIYFSRQRSLVVGLMGCYIFALGIMSLTGERGLIKSYRLWTECKSLDEQNAKAREHNRELMEQVKLMRTDLHAIERYARQELHLAGDREINYIFR